MEFIKADLKHTIKVFNYRKNNPELVLLFDSKSSIIITSEVNFREQIFEATTCRDRTNFASFRLLQE